MLFLCVTQLLLLFRKLPQMKVILYKQRDPARSVFFSASGTLTVAVCGSKISLKSH